MKRKPLALLARERARARKRRAVRAGAFAVVALAATSALDRVDTSAVLVAFAGLPFGAAESMVLPGTAPVEAPEIVVTAEAAALTEQL